jgi:chorismate mutase/prephenate dehydratase
MDLNALRTRLDALDEQIITLLSARARVIECVAHFKQQHHLPVYIPEREAAIIERMRSRNPGPLPDDAVERIYRAVLVEMRELEHASLAP